MNTRCAFKRQLRVRHLTAPLVLALIVAAVATVLSGTGAQAVGLDGRPTNPVQPEQSSTEGQPIAGLPQPVPTEPQVLRTPPPGGLTLGFAGTNSPEAVIAAQAFEVATINVFDVTSQQFLVHIPGSPAFVNTLNESNLTPDSVVILRRTGEPQAPLDLGVQARTAVSAGVPFVLAAPPEGGLTMGMAGTNDLEALIAAQDFEVSTVTMFHVESQRWLVHIPGAPELVQSLTAEFITPDSFVAMRRTGLPPGEAQTATAAEADPSVDAEVTAPAPEEPQSSLRSLGMGRISYYYCEKGTNRAAWGDGGGWCGHFASGKRVYEGGAACAREYRGQRFKIVGDPLDRVYVCEDTGGAVHGNTRDIFFWNSDAASRWIRVVGNQAEILVLDD